jgi:hypothetical protein
VTKPVRAQRLAADKHTAANGWEEF